MPLPSPSVHRFWCVLVDTPSLVMPRGAVILHANLGHLGVGPANPIIEIWAHVDVDAPRVHRRLRIINTGALADVDPATHIATVEREYLGRSDVYHVFDLGEAPE